MSHFESALERMLAGLDVRLQGDEAAFAATSHDDAYRYLLGRRWDAEKPFWTWGLLNPSVARHDKPDPTTRKVRGFTERGGAGGFMIVNLFPYSTDDPAELSRQWVAGRDVVDFERNVHVITRARAFSITGTNTFTSLCVAAWGRIPPKLRAAGARVMPCFRIERDHSPAVRCLGVTNEGFPRHPLMLGYATPLVTMAEARRAVAP